MPASWDETKVLLGMPGEYIVIARKSGNIWYLGGMSVPAKEISIRPDFLDEMEYSCVSWTDTPDADKNPRKVRRAESDVDRTSGLNFTLAANGGFTAILRPRK
jgi:alpha-glucosidase